MRTKEEELQKAKEVSVKSGSSSPAGSLSKHSSPPLQFTAQRISPISLESMGSRLRSNSISSEKQLRNSPPLKRDVGTMSRVYATRDVGVGSPAIPTVLQRTVGTQPNKQVDIKETLYTQLELEEHSTKLLQSHIKHQEKMLIENAKKLISVGTQMYVPKTELKENGIQTMAERKVLKYAIGIMAKPAVRENFVQCMPEMRTVGSSEHSINDVLCERCVLPKRNASCGTDAEAANVNSCISLKNLEMPARSNTFSLGDNEKIKLTRKTQGTQYTPTTVHSMASQTSLKTVHSVGVQNTAEMLNNSTQSQIDSTSAQTDTKDLIHLSTTQTNTEQYQPPKEKVVEKPILPPKPVTYSKGINTETPKTVEYGINTLPTASMCTTSSNTEAIHKRDIACGDVVKPHISIACADNYCDSCKDAIKNLAKDFSKVSAPASPLPSRAVDSKIPRPKNMPSPSMPRRQIQRQNTYTLPSPVEEKKKMSRYVRKL